MKSSKLFKWKNFRNHVSETCKINYAWDRFTDMTFIVQKRRITAHKIILSANSDFFRKILNETPSCVHPTITLPDVSYEDLDAVMQFIYTGELLVHHDRLESVLSLASCFQVKSLMKVQAALIKQNEGTEGVTQKVCHVQRILASRSKSQPQLDTSDILASSSEDEPKLEISNISASGSQNEVKLETLDILASISQCQPKLEISAITPSSSQNHPILSPEHEEQALHYEKTQRKKKFKEHFKNLAGNDKVGQTSSIPAPGELKKKKARKSGVSRSEILMVGGKSNGRALTPKSQIAPRSSHKSIKEKLLREFEKGGTIKEVSKLFNISPSCAFYYKKCFVKAGKLSPSMINYQKKSLYKNTKNKKVAEKARVIDCRPSQPMLTTT